MKVLSLSLVMILALASAGMAADAAVENNGHTYAPIPVGPSAAPSDVHGVLYAKQFTLEKPYTYMWRADRPSITSGWLLVVAVTPSLAEPRDNFYPILYVGRYAAEVTAWDSNDGRLIVMVPGDVDLTRDPIYFGSVEQPGEVSVERASQEMAAAIAGGFKPLTAEALQSARQAGGASITVGDFQDLRAGVISDAIYAYAPMAAGTAEGYRVPRITGTTR